MDKIRTFIAIPLPEKVLNEIVLFLSFLQQIPAGVKWVKPNSCHLTLKFLGDLGQQELKLLCQGMDEVFNEKYRRISLMVHGQGCFPNFQRPRVLWLGIGGEDSSRLVKLHTKIETVLEKKGFPKENKKFSPHITLGRVKTLNNFQELKEKFINYKFSSQKIVVDKVHIMRSMLKPQGAIYSVQKSYYF